MPTRRRSVVALAGSASAVLFVAAALLLPFVGPSALDLAACLAAAGAGLVDPHEPAAVAHAARPLRGRRAGAGRQPVPVDAARRARHALHARRVDRRVARRRDRDRASTGTCVAGVAGIWAGALAGAGVVLFVVMGAATRGGQLSSSSLLLAGIAINSVCAALILLVHGLTGMSQSFAISRWLIGGLDAIEWSTLLVYAGAVVVLVGRRDPAGAAVESAGGRRGVGGHARRQRQARAVPGLRRGLDAGGGHRGADRPDRVRRAGRAAPRCARVSAATTGC